MNITEKNKDRIAALVKMLSKQVETITSLTVDVNDHFNADDYLPLLIDSGLWPMAVDPLLIANPNSEDDKFSRARGILNIIVIDSLAGQKFLDFGCGDGHVVAEAKGKVSVGYDIVEHESWGKLRGDARVFTTKWEEVETNGPYDVVLVYDVLDHVTDEEEATRCLARIKSVLTDQGKVFVRFHPWCSRHGTHLYQQINRAYLHLCFSDKKIEEMGYKQIPTIKLIHPIMSYEKWIRDSGLTKVRFNVTRESIEPFFMESVLAPVIKRNWKHSMDKNLASGQSYPTWQMEQQFVDFVLKKA